MYTFQSTVLKKGALNGADRFDNHARGVPESWRCVLQLIPKAHGGGWWLVLGLYTGNADVSNARDGSDQTACYWRRGVEKHEFPRSDGELTKNQAGGVREGIGEEDAVTQSGQAPALLCECDATSVPCRGSGLSYAFKGRPEAPPLWACTHYGPSQVQLATERHIGRNQDKRPLKCHWVSLPIVTSGQMLSRNFQLNLLQYTISMSLLSFHQ